MVRNTSQFDVIHQCDIHTEEIFLLVGYCIVLVVGVVGNMIVLLTFAPSWKKGPIIELLILYLAFFDLLSSIFTPLLFIYWIATCHLVWDFGWLGCKIIPATARIFTDISIGVILTMAIDRCRSIVTPLRSRFRRKTIHISIMTIIVASCLCEAYYINGLIIREGRCTIVPTHYESYYYPLVVFTSMRNIVFVFIFCVTTVAVDMKLKSASNRRLLLTSQSYSRTHSQRGRIMKMLVVMAIVFAVTVIPRDILHLTYTISSVMSPEDGIYYTVVLRKVNDFLRLLQVSNSIYNVFIYGKMHDHFWQNFKNILYRMKSTRYNAPQYNIGGDKPKRFSSPTYRRSLSFTTNIGRRKILASESAV